MYIAVNMTRIDYKKTYFTCWRRICVAGHLRLVTAYIYCSHILLINVKRFTIFFIFNTKQVLTVLFFPFFFTKTIKNNLIQQEIFLKVLELIFMKSW